MNFVLVLLITTTCLTGCAVNSTQSRIARNGGMYGLLSAQHRKLVASGQIATGMPKDAVYLAWGTPSRIYSMEKQGIAMERWVYTRCKPNHITRVGLGYDSVPPHRRHGYYGCIDYGPRAVYLPEMFAEAIFIDGKVDCWERQKQEEQLRSPDR